MPKRIEKVNSLLEHEISKILLHDFSFSPDILVTITRVETTANLIEAKAYISVYPEEKAETIINAIKKGVYDIQYKINRSLKMRPIPKIIFVKDENMEKVGKVEELLSKLKKEEK